VTVGLRDFTAEERAAGLLFRETFRSRDAVEKGGATLVGTGTTFADGLVLNGSGHIQYTSGPLLPAEKTLNIEFTPAFAANEAVDRLLFDIDNGAGANRTIAYRGADGILYLYAGATTLIGSIAYVTWSPVWVALGRNVLTIAYKSGVSYVWLNGTLILTSGVVFANPAVRRYNIGRTGTNTLPFIGTIHSFSIYGFACTAVDEPHLRNKTLISALDNPLVVLPGTSFYKRASDSKYVTEVRGKAGITEALMGSDGATAAQFPSIIKPRGFSFDGGDQINLGDNDQFSFTNGVNDLPFSVACIIRPALTCTGPRSIIHKVSGFNVGEYHVWLTESGGTYSAVLQIIDATSVAYIGRYTSLLRLGNTVVLIVTDSGSGLSSGIKIYADAARVDTTNYADGAYVRMRNTANALKLAPAVAGMTNPFIGDQSLPIIDNVEWSPMQVRALTARLRRQARAA
jgi:hypothetical protein